MDIDEIVAKSHLVLHGAGAVGVLKGGKCLVQVAFGGRDTRDHDCAAIATCTPHNTYRHTYRHTYIMFTNYIRVLGSRFHVVTNITTWHER
jgi:hypothetical protein